MASSVDSGQKLNLPQRLIAAVLGIACLAGGAVAVFVTENGTGSAALIAAGTLLLAVALVGRLVGLKVGGAEATFGEVAREAADTLEAVAGEATQEGDEEKASELIETAAKLRRTTDGPPRRTGLPDDYRIRREWRTAFEASTVAALTSIAQAAQFEFEIDATYLDDISRWDLIARRGHVVVLVDATYVSDPRVLPMRVVDRVGRAAINVLLGDSPAGLLLIANTLNVSHRWRDLLDRLPFVELVEWEPGYPPEALESGLSRLVARLAGDE